MFAVFSAFKLRLKFEGKEMFFQHWQIWSLEVVKYKHKLTLNRNMHRYYVPQIYLCSNDKLNFELSFLKQFPEYAISSWLSNFMME